MKRGNNININGSFKELIPALTDDLDGFGTSVEEVSADGAEIKRTRTRSGA